MSLIAKIQKSLYSLLNCDLGRNKDSFLKLNLRFVEETVENDYRKMMIGYLQKSFRFYQLSAFFLMVLTWLADPIDNSHFEGQKLMFSLLNAILNLIAAIYFHFKRHFKYPHFGIFFLQIYLTLGYIEASQETISFKYTSTSFITTSMGLELNMLIPMISRCPWKINLVSSLLLNSYLSFRFINFSDNKDLKGYPLWLLSLNFLFISLGSYFNEKYDREVFYKRFKDEQSLKRFEEIIKEGMPASIIIYRDNEILFSNKETARILRAAEDKSVEKCLQEIIITSNQDNYEKNDLWDFNINTANPFIDKREKEKVDICYYFDHFLKSEERKDFLRITGNLSQPETIQNFDINEENNNIALKYLDIRLGRIPWKGKDAVIAIVTEDFVAQRLFDLQEQARYKDRLLATVSHDLRTPLNGVIGILDLTLQDDLEKNLKKSLLLALRSSNLLLYMINDILDFSQISKGTLSLNPIKFSIAAMIRDVTKLIKFQAKKKGINLDIDNKLNKDDDFSLCSDPNRIKQILLNLLGNALKFTQVGYIRLTIEAFDEKLPDLIQEGNEIDYCKAEKRDKPIKLTVEDTGCGIKKEDIPKLFKLFGMLRNKESKKLNSTGVGLGLAISQQLVKILNDFKEGAEIKVESEYGKGSKFSFLLHSINNNKGSDIVFKQNNKNNNRINPESAASIELQPESPFHLDISFKNEPKIFTVRSHEKKIYSFSSKKNILLVDDDQINILVLTKFLVKFEDCDFSVALNGEQAIKIIKEKSNQNIFFDAIFMDCNMPIMDGFEATKRILSMVQNNEIPNICIIASTANASQIDLDRCFSCGMVDFISKPFTIKTLREKIDLYCKRN